MQRFLSFVPLYVLLSAVPTCGDDDTFYPEVRSLELTVENGRSVYETGDTLWLNSTFSSVGEGFRSFEINGGLISIVPARVTADSTYRAALDSELTAVSSVGELLPENSSEASATWQFTCPAENCSLRVGYRLNQPGRYLLSIPTPSVSSPNLSPRFVPWVVWADATGSVLPALEELPEDILVRGRPYSLRSGINGERNLLIPFGVE